MLRLERGTDRRQERVPRDPPTPIPRSERESAQRKKNLSSFLLSSVGVLEDGTGWDGYQVEREGGFYSLYFLYFLSSKVRKDIFFSFLLNESIG